MKINTKILCYSGTTVCNTKRVKKVEYTVVDIGNGTFKRKINKRYLK